MSTFRERLTFDAAAGAWMDQTRRYMMIRPDALMGIFRSLPEAARQQALDALETSIFAQGGDSARAYLAMGGTSDALLATIAETAPMLGWGRWSLQRQADALHLEVINSPFAAGFGLSPTPVCHAIKGMLAAVSGLVLGAGVRVVETRCAATGAPSCRFVASANP